MRWSASSLALGVVLATGVAPGSPATYHSGDRAVCADCHQSDDAAPAGGNEMCLRCHDDRSGIPDVVDDDRNRLRERSGGFFREPGSPNPGGHDLAGRRGSSGLLCVDCHDPHGPATARLLRVPSRAIELGLFVSGQARGLERYERRNVAYGTLDDPTLREASLLCLSCHGELASDRPEHGGHTTHPTYNSEEGVSPHVSDGAAGGATDPVHWRAGEGYDFDLIGRLPVVVTGAADFASAARVDPRTAGVFCLTCHLAHGGDHAFGMRWDYGRSATARAGCDQCHAVDPMPGFDPLTAQRP